MTALTASAGDVRHIMFILPERESGGMGKAMCSLARVSALRNWRVTILTFEPVRTPETLPNIRVSFVGTRNVRFAFGPVIRALREDRPEVVVTASPQVNLLAIVCVRLFSRKSKVVVTEHTIFDWLFQRVPSAKLRLVRAARNLLYKSAYCVVPVSHAVARELSTIPGVHGKTLVVIGNSVLNPEFISGAQLAPRHPWLSDKRGPVVVALGHLIEPKGFDILIAAFAEVRRHSNSRLVIFGEGNQRVRLEGLIALLGLGDCVSLPGAVSNPYAEIAAADLLASASLVEAAPLTVSEALCLGVPVVAANAEGGMADILGEGRYGRLVPVNDAGALAAAIIDTLKMPRRLPDRESIERFTETRVLEQWESILPRALVPANGN